MKSRPKRSNARKRSPAALRSRAAAACEVTIEYVPHASFARRMRGEPPRFSAAGERATRPSPSFTRLGPYIERLYDVPLLTAEQESDGFRWMNYLKHQAARLQKAIDPQQPDLPQLERFEGLLADAVALRDRLIEANLRLVVSIAKKFAAPFTPLDELVSEGNVALMHAVEKFDFSRGFRFSTYATYAIQRRLYHSVATLRRRQSRFPSLNSAEFDEQEDAASALTEEGRWRRLARCHAPLHQLIDRLDERQKAIVRLRFGIGAGAASQTLREIAAMLGICKERVRQLEAKALRHLRECAESEPQLLTELFCVTD